MNNGQKTALGIVTTRPDVVTDILSANPRTPDRSNLVTNKPDTTPNPETTPKKQE